MCNKEHVSKLTIKMLEGNAAPEEIEELEKLISSDDEAMKTHIVLLEQEAILRGSKTDLDLTDPIMKQISEVSPVNILEGREAISAGSGSQISPFLFISSAAAAAVIFIIMGIYLYTISENLQKTHSTMEGVKSDLASAKSKFLKETAEYTKNLQDLQQKNGKLAAEAEIIAKNFTEMKASYTEDKKALDELKIKYQDDKQKLESMTARYQAEQKRAEDLSKIYQFKQDELDESTIKLNNLNAKYKNLTEQLKDEEEKANGYRVVLSEVKKRYNIDVLEWLNKPTVPDSDSTVSENNDDVVNAETRLEKAMNEMSKVKEENKAYGHSYLDIAKGQYGKFRYEEAKENLKLALRYDPENKEAEQLLEKTQALLGERPDKVRTFYEWALKEQKVKIQQRKYEMENLIKEGKDLYNSGRAGEAAEKFEAALQIHRWMPYKMEFPDIKNEAQKWYDATKGNDTGNSEQYEPAEENSFTSPFEEPLSTFSIDVDTASYTNIRRFINNSQIPPRYAVRIEEMLNFFTYDYPRSEGKDPFSINTELSECPWNTDHQLLHIGLQGKRLNMEELPPGNLVFLIDVSGSMDSPKKLPLLKTSMKLLVDQLRDKDRVAIVVYASTAGIILNSTSGSEKALLKMTIDDLKADGSTAGGAGLQMAYEEARRNFIKNGNNRVILATDGDFNVGVTSDDELVSMIEKERKGGIFLTVLGFGTGNYKDAKMEKLADHGNGNYAYIDSVLEGKRVLMEEYSGTLYTIAKDVKIQIEFNPGKVAAYRLIGYENRALENKDFADDTKDAGEIGAGHSVTALYEIISAEDVKSDLPEISKGLKYQKLVVSSGKNESNELMTVKFRYKKPDEDTSMLITKAVQAETVELDKTTDTFRFAAAVAEFGLLLKDSMYKGTSNFKQITELAKKAKGIDEEGHRAEFIRLVETLELLADKEPEQPLKPRKVSKPGPRNATVLAVAKDKQSNKIQMVMLDVGRKDGVKEGYQFVIFREDSYICKVKVEKVFDDMCTAKIVPESRARNQDGTEEEIRQYDKAATRLY